MRKIRDFFDDLTKKHPFGWWEFKKLWKFEILKFDRRTVGSAAVCTPGTGLVPGPTGVRPEFCLIRCIIKLKYFFACCCACMG